MAKYTPISPASLVPGLPGSDGALSTLVANSQRLYGDATNGGYRPVIAAGTGHGSDDTILNTTGTTPVEVARVMIPKNADNEDLLVTVRGKAGSGHTGRWAVAYGGASGVGATTSTAETTVEITVTPSGSGHPREAILTHYGGSAGHTVYTLGFTFQIEAGAAAGAGPNVSGYIEPDADIYLANRPITSERVARLMNNSRAIARDRPATIYSLVEPPGWASTRTASGADSTTPVLVARSVLLPVEGAPRSYRVSMYLTADAGVTPKCTIAIGGHQVTGTATGWTHGTVTLGGSSGCVMEASISRTAGSGHAYLKTLQIMREP